MKLTEHFNLDEFTCNCKKCEGKLPNEKILANIKKLAETLEVYRKISGKPFKINCGYRCPEHNKAVGGVSNSVHMTGSAADVVIQGLDAKQMFQFMANMSIDKIPGKPKSMFKGVGYYPTKGFVHVDLGVNSARPNTWKG